MESNIKYWVWLSTIAGLGSRKYMKIINKYGDPEVLWNLTYAELKNLAFIPKAVVNQILDTKIKDEVDRHMERIYKNNIKVLTINDDIYPIFLKNIHDPPMVIYVKGNLIQNEKAVAVVGSRVATPYGLKMAEAISRELTKCGITVISGMARGVDSSAHIGALNSGGRTIAVLGCGLDKAYPPENDKLMKRIEETGTVISEYVPGVVPLPQNFPARNRIISGISMGVVVIEANEKSGSLITADFALEQGREVFAVPGNLSSPNSIGTNKLIKDGAKIVTCIEDILEEINVFRNTAINIFEQKELEKARIFKDLDPDERILAECLFNQPMHIDAIIEKSGLEIKTINAILVMLELKGCIDQLPGKIFKYRE
jgi:DNA processing protein